MPPAPTNPYGTSKLMDEWILRDLAKASKLRYVILRYFNVAGADPESRMGQRTPEATHLIKVACQYALGRRDHLQIFGDDYNTPDGTCVRDYIHIEDLADAHLKSLSHLLDGGAGGLYNCGYGQGYSVKEVIDVVGEVHGTKLNPEITGRRPGDVSSLVADSSKLMKEMKWKPKYADLNLIVRDAYNWERRL